MKQNNFPGGSEESSFNAGDWGFDRSGGSPGEVNDYPLQYYCLEKLHGQRSLVGYSSWGCKELDMTEQLTFSISKLLHIEYVLVNQVSTST